jgi:signal transduction histidine kinase
VDSRNVNLIISDLVMPQMGGLELLEGLRDKGLDIPTILMTFHGSEGTAVRAFRLGARDYIIKPFAIEEMLNAIDRALTESRLRQERDRLTQTVLQVNRQLENRVQELRFLYGIGRSVTALLDLEQILSRIVEAAVYLTSAEEGSLMLVDQDSGELYLRAERGMGEKSAKNLRLKIQDSIAGQVVRTGRPVMIGGINQDDSFKVKTGYFVKSLLNVPLKVTDQVIGVLAVHNKSTARPFSDRHLNLLLALADYASIAIDNARLYARLFLDVTKAEQSSRELKKMVKVRTAALNKINRQLLQTEKLATLGYFAAGVAQEITAPINTILDNLRQLEQRLEPTANNVELISSLEKEALHCRQTIQSLFDFSIQKEYHPEAADLNQLIEAAWSKYSDEYDGTDNVEFVRGFDPNLPQISVDGKQIQQALFYLIRNAYRSMPDGGTLRITSRAVGYDLQIIVSDSGPGIAQEDMRHIFEPFYQPNDQPHNMDLSITRAVIERHNGTIEVESEAGQGTTFTIHLPTK